MGFLTTLVYKDGSKTKAFVSCDDFGLHVSISAGRRLRDFLLGK